MRSLIFFILSFLSLCASAQDVSNSQQTTASIKVGMCDTAAYFPLIEGKRVAILANHTSMAVVEPDSAPIHIVDLLYRRGFTLAGIFSPEHGFRGTANAGQKIDNSIDEATNTPILSLYNGDTNRPSEAYMSSFDVLLIDIQDVGLRFYTYYIAMLRMMEACADSGIPVVVLDRPNPNGHYIDGPILDMRYKSGVGALPIPVVHGLTMGEIARMAIGQGWVKSCDLEVVACQNYTHATPYILPIAPSPNLPTQLSIYLYPSICLFEGTPLSLGRGTDFPFQVFGHPNMRGYNFSFTPRAMAGAQQPSLCGQKCYGVNLNQMPLEQAHNIGFSLSYIIEAYNNLDLGDNFFTPMFEKLVGVDYVRQMIMDGATQEQIRACWSDEVEQYKVMREKYLLYK